jgi:hypothetical protein
MSRKLSRNTWPNPAKPTKKPTVEAANNHARSNRNLPQQEPPQKNTVKKGKSREARSGKGPRRRAHHAAAPRDRGGKRGRGARGVVAHGRPEAVEQEVAAVHRARPPPPERGHLHARRRRDPPAEHEHEQPRGVRQREEQHHRAGPPSAAVGRPQRRLSPRAH